MKISVILEALTGGFETDMKRAAKASEKAFAQMKKDAQASNVAIGKVFTAAAAGAAVAVAGMGYAVKQAVNEMDTLSKTAQKVGVTTEALSALQYAAELADVDIGQLQAGMTRLVKAQADVARGSEKQVALFEELGVQVMNADGTLRNAGDVMADVADKFAAMEDGADKTAIAVQIFGRAGADLIPLLNGGAQGLRDATREAEAFGLIVSTEAGRAAEEFNDNLTRMGRAVSGAAIQLGTDLLPVLNDLSGQVVGMAKDPAFRRDLAEAIRTIGEAAIDAAKGITTLVNVSKFLYDEARQLVGSVDPDDLVRQYEKLAGLQGQLDGMVAGRMGESPQAQQLRDEIAAIEANIAAQEKLINTRARIDTDLQEIDTSGIPGRRQAPASRIYRPTAGATTERDPYQKSTNAAEYQMQLAEEAFREIEERAREHQANMDQLNGLKMAAMDDEARAVAELQAQYIELQNLIAKGAVTQEEAIRISAGLAERWAEDAKEKTTEMSEFAKAAAQNMQTAFADFLFDPFSGSLKEMALDFVNVLRRMAAEAVAAAIFNKIIGSVGAAAGGPGIVGSLLSAFAGPKDAGGSIPSGSFAMVGERRPELVAGPATVMGGAQTASMMQRNKGRDETKIRLISITDSQNVADYLSSDPGEQNLIAFANKNRGFFKQLVS